MFHGTAGMFDCGDCLVCGVINIFCDRLVTVCGFLIFFCFLYVLGHIVVRQRFGLSAAERPNGKRTDCNGRNSQKTNFDFSHMIRNSCGRIYTSIPIRYISDQIVKGNQHENRFYSHLMVFILSAITT